MMIVLFPKTIHNLHSIEIIEIDNSFCLLENEIDVKRFEKEFDGYNYDMWEINKIVQPYHFFEAITEGNLLKKIIFKHIYLKKIPSSISNHQNLHHIELISNDIHDLPELVKNCKKLKYLEFSCDSSHNVPQVIWELISLETLILVNIKQISRKIVQLQQLKELNISLTIEVNSNVFPTEMNQLKTLESISINYQTMDQFPLWVYEIPNLKNLNLLCIVQNKELNYSIHKEIYQFMELHKKCIVDFEVKEIPLRNPNNKNQLQTEI